MTYSDNDLTSSDRGHSSSCVELPCSGEFPDRVADPGLDAVVRRYLTGGTCQSIGGMLLRERRMSFTLPPRAHTVLQARADDASTAPSWSSCLRSAFLVPRRAVLAAKYGLYRLLFFRCGNIQWVCERDLSVLSRNVQRLSISIKRRLDRYDLNGAYLKSEGCDASTSLRRRVEGCISNSDASKQRRAMRASASSLT